MVGVDQEIDLSPTLGNKEKEKDVITNATEKLRKAVERRNAVAAKVRRLEDALYEANRALNFAENKVRAVHANAPEGTLIRFGGEAWELLGYDGTIKEA